MAHSIISSMGVTVVTESFSLYLFSFSEAWGILYLANNCASKFPKYPLQIVPQPYIVPLIRVSIILGRGFLPFLGAVKLGEMPRLSRWNASKEKS